jgi:hypothetical protein
LDPSLGRVYISRNVIFDETVFPFSTLKPNAGALLKNEISLLHPTLRTPQDGVCVGEPTVINDANLDHEVLADFTDFLASNGDPQPAEPRNAEDPGMRSGGDPVSGEAALDRERIPIGEDYVPQQSVAAACPADPASRPPASPCLHGSSVDSCGNQTSASQHVGAALENVILTPSEPQDRPRTHL